MWVMGFVSSLAYVVIFYQYKFYADMGMNIYYSLASVYGLYAWKYRGGAGRRALSVSRTTLRHVATLVPVAVALLAAIFYILKSCTDSSMPFGDAFTTALSVVAMWMLAQKLLEHWLLWVVINYTSVALYLYKGMYPTAALFVVFGTLAVYGYFKWKRTMQ